MFNGDLIAERARLTPENVALIVAETEQRFTYREFHVLVDRATTAVLRGGVTPGDRYGILAHNSVEFLAFFFAAARVGAIVVPLSTRGTSHELTQIAADCAMKVVFHDDHFATSAAQLAIPSHPLRLSDPGAFVSAPSDDEATYCLLYTSGTTGKPKGVMIPKRQLYWNGYNTAVCWGLREDDISPIYTPLYHAGGVAAFLIPIFTMGGAIVLHKTFDASEVWRVIQRERCTVVLGVPTTWKMLMEAPEFATANLDHVRWFISGGAPLPDYIMEAYQKRGVTMKQGYGMTEVGVNCFSMSVEESRRKAGSIGKPMMFTQVRLVDADSRDVADGEIGEMWIRGPHVSSGYWKNDGATRSTYLADGWLATGDLARRDDDGFFYIAGRRKEMFISGGVNVYPAEIEAELVSHPQVIDAAVVALPDDTWGEVAVAFVVGSAGEQELTAYLVTRVAKFKLPRRYVFVDTLPRTPYGKVEKQKLLEFLSS